MKTLIIVAHPQIENSTTQQFFKEGLAGFIECARHGRQLGGESPLWAVVVGTTSQGQGCPL